MYNTNRDTFTANELIKTAGDRLHVRLQEVEYLKPKASGYDLFLVGHSAADAGFLKHSHIRSKVVEWLREGKTPEQVATLFSVQGDNGNVESTLYDAAEKVSSTRREQNTPEQMLYAKAHAFDEVFTNIMNN